MNVAIYQQTGGNCVEGSTWGYDHGNIWTHGCYGVFQVWQNVAPTPDPQPEVKYVTCGASLDQEVFYTRVGYGMSVALYQQTGGNCVQGSTWGYDHGNIWTHGCFGIFQVWQN